MSAAAETVVPSTESVVEAGTVTDLAAFNALEHEWNGLVEASGLDHPFLTHAWLRNWWSAFGQGRSLYIVTVRHYGRLIGAAPLMLAEQRLLGLSTRTLESIANDHSPRFDFLVARDHEALAQAGLWRRLSDGGADWDLLQLRAVPTGSSTLQRLVACARRHGLPVGRWDAERSPYVRFDGAWDDYFAGLGHNHKRNVGKGLRRLQRRGKVELEVVSSPAALADALADGMRIEALAWKARAGTAMVSNPDVQAFYESYAREAAERGLLRLMFLRCGGQRIAFSYGLQFERTIFVLKGGYDPDFARYSPYQVLYALVFQHGFAADLEGYEFLGGDEPFKMKWTDRVVPHCWLFVFSRSPRGRLLHFFKFNAMPRLRAWRPYAIALSAFRAVTAKLH